MGGVVGDVNCSRGSCTTRRVTHALHYTTLLLVYFLLLIVIDETKFLVFINSIVYHTDFICESKFLIINNNTAIYNFINETNRPTLKYHLKSCFHNGKRTVCLGKG